MTEQILRKIAVDPGFGGFKVAEVQGNEVVVDIIPAVIGIGQTSAKSLTAGLEGKRGKTKPFVITFDGISYLVGPNVHLYTRPVERLDYQRLANGPELRTLLYAALWKMVGGGTHSVALMIGFPVAVMQDGAQAQSIIKKLRAWAVGKHSFTVNDDPVTVTITKVKAVAQPLGTYLDWGLNTQGRWPQRKEAMKLPVGIADIGFNTLDLFAIENGRSVARFTGGDKLGMRRANTAIRKEVQQRYGVEMSLRQTDALIRAQTRGRKPIVYHPAGAADVSDLIEQALDNTFSEISSFIEELWGSAMQFRYLLITGGGAYVLQKRLVQQYPIAIILPNSVTANAEGMAKFIVQSKVFK